MAKRKTNFTSKVRRSIVGLARLSKELLFELEKLDSQFGSGMRRRLYQTVYKLAYRNEIIKRPNGKYQLTNFGVVKLLPAVRQQLSGDGKVRILVFDIPENEKRKREAFRAHIRVLGFKMHQKSVWVSHDDCERWLLPIIQHHQVGDYTSLYIGDHIW